VSVTARPQRQLGTTAPPVRQPRPRRAARSENAAAWLMLAPAIGLLLWWFVSPIIQSVVLSFQEVNKFRFSDRTFVGVANYAELFSDSAFLRSLGITGTFVAGVVPAQTLLALLVAAALHGVTRGRTALRTAYFVPYMTSTVAITTIFMQLFVRGGPATTALSVLGLPDATWYAESSLALGFLVIVYVYMFVGLYIVIFVGGIETIPDYLYEAASMDGAGVLRRFWHVTLPGIRPFAVFVVVAGIIQAIQVFDQAYVISGGTVLGSPAGATSTIVIFIYQQAFRLNAVGYASAATVVLLVFVLVTGLISRRVAPKEA
jgi:multiple sugar transport system permease protein